MKLINRLAPTTGAKIVMFYIIGAILLACGDIPKEGDGTEKIQIKMELQYDNPTDNETLFEDEE
jgi:hypothetical protein